jgi:membrane fusion protein (multidrug efflux system)
MPPTLVDTFTVKPREVSNTLKAVGSIRAIEAVEVRPEVSGKIVQINFKDGQLVTAGMLLFALDSEIERAQYNEAMANVRASERNRPRVLELANKQLISKSAAEEALNISEVNTAKAQSAKARLDKMQIRAPFEGVVGLRQVSIGAYVNAGQALVELVRLNPLEVEFQVPESQVARLATGQSVNVQLDAMPDVKFDGAITAIAPSVQINGRSVSVRAKLNNQEGKLVPGQFAQVLVELSKAAPTMMIPEQAIWPNGDQKMVYVVSKGKANLVPVQLGSREPGWVEIASGLKEGDVVITAGQMKLFPGAPVMLAKPAKK